MVSTSFYNKATLVVLWLSVVLYLHYAVPVVTSGDLEEGEERHTEVLKGGVPTHALTWVVLVAHCREQTET